MNFISLGNGSPAVTRGAASQIATTQTTAAREDLGVLLGRLPLVGLLAVQAVIGYEWAMSGLTKIARGGFPAGLADELREKSEGAPGWYRTVIDDVLVTNGQTVGYLTEIGER